MAEQLPLKIDASGNLAQFEAGDSISSSIAPGSASTSDGRISRRITVAKTLSSHEQYIVHEELLLEAWMTVETDAELVII